MLRQSGCRDSSAFTAPASKNSMVTPGSAPGSLNDGDFHPQLGFSFHKTTNYE